MMTLEMHIALEQAHLPYDSRGALEVVHCMAMASKTIADKVRRLGLHSLKGSSGLINASGDDTKQMDEYAHSIIVQTASECDYIGGMVSEEHPDVIQASRSGKYVVSFDPLDGSSNIDSNMPVGTIFSVHRKTSQMPWMEHSDFLQKGSAQAAAGYAIYGPSTMFVYTAGHTERGGTGVHGFTLDPSRNEFVLTHPNMRMPDFGKIYSTNEGNLPYWDYRDIAYVDWLKQKSRVLRYVGALVADFHRTLISGGIFLYQTPKLRLLYEAAPLAMISQYAGGAAIDIGGTPIVAVPPTELHQKTSLVIGSSYDVGEYSEFKRVFGLKHLGDQNNAGLPL